MKTHGLVIALAVVLAAWPGVSQEEDPAERQMRLIEEEWEESPTIKDVPVEPPGSKRIRVTIRFSKTDVREAIAAVAKIAGVNIQVDAKVKGEVTLALKDIPWRDALTAITTRVKAQLVTGKDGTFRIVGLAPLVFHQEAVKVKTADGKVTWSGRVVLPDGKPLQVVLPALKPLQVVQPAGKPLRVLNAPGSYRVALLPYLQDANDKISNDLRAAIKALRAAGLEKEAKAAEAELKRREALLKRFTVISDPQLTNSIQALRADLAALRKEVRELTALVRKLAEKE